MLSYTWEDFDNEKIIQLREKFNLESYVSGNSEYERQTQLKKWIHLNLPKGNPEKDYSMDSAMEIILDSQIGKPMWCTQYAFAYLQCAISLGWYCRKLSVDVDHNFDQEEMHHGVVDIWSNQFNKWFVVDPMNNIHFEKDGIPLNSLEIRREFFNDGAIHVKGIIGNRDNVIEFKEKDRGFNTPSNYFWFFISLRNNFMEEPGLFKTKALLWIDKYNEAKIWYKGGESKGDSYEHPMYKSQFIKTDDEDLCFPIMKL